MSGHGILSRNKSIIDKLSYLNFASEDQQRIIFKVSQSIFHSISAFITMIMRSGFLGKTYIFKVIDTIFLKYKAMASLRSGETEAGVCVWGKAFESVPGGGRPGVPRAKSGTHSSPLSQLRAVTAGLGTRNICWSLTDLQASKTRKLWKQQDITLLCS